MENDSSSTSDIYSDGPVVRGGEAVIQQDKLMEFDPATGDLFRRAYINMMVARSDDSENLKRKPTKD